VWVQLNESMVLVRLFTVIGREAVAELKTVCKVGLDNGFYDIESRPRALALATAWVLFRTPSFP